MSLKTSIPTMHLLFVLSVVWVLMPFGRDRLWRKFRPQASDVTFAPDIQGTSVVVIR